MLRQLGKILRGKATPFQILAACTLGGTLGFVLEPSQAPGLVLALLLGLFFLNANVGVALATGALARLVALFMVPYTFEAGRLLLDGPLGPLFSALINAPVFAYFGFEHYVVTGGLALGAIFGILLGLALVNAVGQFRRRAMNLEQNSERYRNFFAKPHVRVITFLFFGLGRGKKSYEQLLERKVGFPFRIVGIAAGILIVVALYLLQDKLTAPVLRSALQQGLEEANGATVELREVDLDLSAGRLILHGLALADRNDLETDLLRAERIEADVSTADLLRKRLVVDRLAVREAWSGVQRDVPGVSFRKDPPVEKETEGQGRTLEDYIEAYDTWKSRLSQTREWLRRFAKVRELSADEEPSEEDLEERLWKEVQERGFLRVTADHLVQDSPRLLVRELVIEGLETPRLPGEVLDLEALALSTEPHLVAQGPRLALRTRSDRLRVELGLDEASGDPGANGIDFRFEGIPVDSIASQLKIDGSTTLSGGTVDLSLHGSWEVGGVGEIDLPLEVDVRNSTFYLPDRDPIPVEHVRLPVYLSGALDAPRIRIDNQELLGELVKAGATELVDELKQEALGELDEARDQVEDKLKDKAQGLFDKLKKKD